MAYDREFLNIREYFTFIVMDWGEMIMATMIKWKHLVFIDEYGNGGGGGGRAMRQWSGKRAEY